jgi:RTX calcium-binding nonapeptide repeat (4 copies)
VTYAPDAAAGGTRGVFVALIDGFAIDGFGNNEWLSAFKGVIGTNSSYAPGGYFSDSLIGNGGATFYGLGGNDYFEGKSVYIYNDDKSSYALDFLYGGAAGVYVDLGDGTAANPGVARDGFGSYDTLIYINKVVGTNSSFTPSSYFGDLLYGANSGATTLYGVGGNDVIVGRGANNTASYAMDDANGGHAGIFADLAKGFVQDGFGAFDFLFGIQNITGTQYNDVIIGGDGDNVLRGGLGSDYIDLCAGNDRIAFPTFEMAANDLDIVHSFQAGDSLQFKDAMHYVTGSWQQGSDVIVFVRLENSGVWYLDVQNTDLATVQAALHFDLLIY